MSAYFPIRAKELVGLILFQFIITLTVYTQPRPLLPELSFASGLPDNVVRVIRHDDQHRIWIGTDKGLIILSTHEPDLIQLQKEIGLSLVWSLAFIKEYVLIGTRDNGLFIYNLKQKKLEKHFEKERIIRCRNIRVFGDSAYIASKPTGFIASLQQGKWKLDSLKTSYGSPTYIMDYFDWNGVRYSAQHLDYPTSAFKLKKDSILEKENLPFQKQITQGAILSSLKTDSNLYLGLATFYYKINTRSEFKDSIIQKIDSQNTNAIWEIRAVKNRVLMATGNPSNIRGMIFEPGITTMQEDNPEFYVQTMDRDPVHKGLWFGVSDVGLFYWPLMEQTYHLPFKWQKDATLFVTQNRKLLLVKDKSYLPIKLENSQYVADGPVQHLPMNDAIRQLEIYGDTLVAISSNDIFVRIKDKTLHFTNPENYQGIIKRGHHIYSYSKYAAPILDLNTVDGKTSRLPFNYTELKYEKYGTNFMLHSGGIGFTYFDSTLKTMSNFLPTVDEYKMLGDTLWLLIGRELRAYLFHPKDTSFKLLLNWDFKNSLSDFVPKWMQVIKNQLFLGSQYGYFKIDTRTATPQWYQYTGNYKDLVKPKTDGVLLYFHRENYLTAVMPQQPYEMTALRTVKPAFIDSSTLLEREPLEIVFKTQDYFLKLRALKKLELQKEGKIIATYYTLDSLLQIKQGLPSGEYKLKIWVNGQAVAPLIFKISIPLLKNPAFYITITLFFILLISFITFGWLQRKGLQKRLLESRLQLLKQNLNPHFIFNSLNLIYMLVLLKKNEQAVKTIANFSDLHRYYLENVSKDKVSLQEELAFIKSYLLLESERVHLDAPFEYHLPESIDENLLALRLPPMILQPLVENAVKFCQPLGYQTAQVWIDVELTEGKIIIGVENTVSGTRKHDIKGTGSGIRMVKERIEINNHTGKQRIEMNLKTSPKYSISGYRVELGIWNS